MSAAAPTKLDLFECYTLAWRSFAKWWIPLCLISAGILAFKLAPKLLAHEKRSRLTRDCRVMLDAAMARDEMATENAIAAVTRDLQDLAHTVARYGTIAMPFVFVLWSVLLLFANRAVKNRKDKRSPGRVLLVAWWRLWLLLFKMFPSLAWALAVGALLFRGFQFESIPQLLVFLGISGVLLLVITPIWLFYTYTKLLFVPLLMFEKQLGGWRAVKASWEQTNGHFWMLLLIILLNTCIQAALAATIIGAIPGLSFVETVRAAAFRMTLPPEDAGPESQDTGSRDRDDSAPSAGPAA